MHTNSKPDYVLSRYRRALENVGSHVLVSLEVRSKMHAYLPAVALAVGWERAVRKYCPWVVL